MVWIMWIGLIVCVVWVALGAAAYCLSELELKSGPKYKRNKILISVAVALLVAVLLNSGTFALARGMMAMVSYDGSPKLVTLHDAGLYQTDEVHYLIAGEQTRPEDMASILPDGLHGTIKAVKYQQLQYYPDSVAKELSRDVMRNGYDKVTIWAIGSGALVADEAGTKSGLKDRLKIILINPCLSTLVLQPEPQKMTDKGIIWQRVLVYLEGWFSLIPNASGHSHNLRTMQRCYLVEESKNAYRPSTDKILGVLISEQDEYLQTGALKGLYEDAIQVSVPATHGDIVNSRELYQEALTEIWAQHLAEIEEAETEPDDYTGPFPEDPT